MTQVDRFNGQSRGEEVSNAITHGIGTGLAVSGTVMMIVSTVQGGGAWHFASALVFGISLIMLYGASTIYHSVCNIKAKKVLQIIDHCSIFILILGTYAPFCLVLLKGIQGWLLFGCNAAVAVTGIILNSISVKKFHKFSLIFYLLMGWSVILLIKPIIAGLAMSGIVLLLAGGVLYTAGVLFYAMKRPRYMHMVWHLFVLGGSILHFICIYKYVLPIN